MHTCVTKERSLGVNAYPGQLRTYPANCSRLFCTKSGYHKEQRWGQLSRLIPSDGMGQNSCTPFSKLTLRDFGRLKYIAIVAGGLISTP